MASTTAPRRSAARRAARALTWREVLIGSGAWTRTAHGTYRHADGRTVLKDGDGFVCRDADGARPGRQLGVEFWDEIRDWAAA